MTISNIYEILIEEQSFPVQVIPYSKETLETLRCKYNAIYSFFRFGEDIVAIWMEGQRMDLGRERMINWGDALEICQSACRHLLFRTFVRQLPGLKPLDFSPLRFLSRKEKHDVIRDALPSELKDVAWHRTAFKQAR